MCNRFMNPSDLLIWVFFSHGLWRDSLYQSIPLPLIKIEATEVCGRWREYFEVLLNGENESEFDVLEAVEEPLYEITEQEVEKALKGMKNDKSSWTILADK